MPLEVAVLPVEVKLTTGEAVLLPAEIWQALDAATQAAADAAGDERIAFMLGFAKAMVDAGLVLVKPSDPRSSQSVTVQTYALALQGKHAAEAKVEAARKVIEGWEAEACGTRLVEDLSTGILSITGRAAPEERRNLKIAFLRLRALSAICRGNATGGWDIDQADPLPQQLVEFLDEVWP